MNVPPRLLMGPGPINIYPQVQAALGQQLIGQFDPVMTGLMNDTMAAYRTVFNTENDATILVDGTARAGIEAALVSLLEPGDDVVVLRIGRFGHLLEEIAVRCGAVVHPVDAPWGEVVSADQVADTLARVQPKLLASVHGDTSTTMCQPLAEIGRMCRDAGVISYVDATASIIGNPFHVDAWHLDVASAGLQKCLGGPPGIAPITLNPTAVELIRGRSVVEAGLRTEADEPVTTAPIASNYFDVGMLLNYWGERRLNHHTEATSMLYAALACAQLAAAEGPANVIERHRIHGEAMAAGVDGLGLRRFGNQSHRMYNVVGVEIPDGVDGDPVRHELLTHYGIEIGTSFGPLHGRIWRIGTMGYNARTDAVLLTLAALEQSLRRAGVAVPAGGGVDAALDSYRAAGLPT